MTGLVNVTKSYFSGVNIIDGVPSTLRGESHEQKKRKADAFHIKYWSCIEQSGNPAPVLQRYFVVFCFYDTQQPSSQKGLAFFVFFI